MYRRLIAASLLVCGSALAAPPGSRDAKPPAPAQAPAGVSPSAAASLKSIEALQKAVTDAWERSPLIARRAMFVSAPAKLYGAYDERPSNVFGLGEPLYTYLEPVGYAWKPAGNDTFQFGVEADYVLKTAEGRILGGQERFLTFTQTSHYKNQELMVNVTIRLNDAPPGDYVLQYKLRDSGSDKSTVFEQPFKIVR